MSRATKARVEIETLLRGHLRAVLAIDRASFDRPWNGKRFLEVLQAQHVNGRVAVTATRVVGFYVYRISSSEIHVARIAVAPEFRGMGVGAAMVGSLTERADRFPRAKITLNVRETNRAGIDFWGACGFRATGILREHYDDGQDAYMFEYRNPECHGR